MNARHRTGRRLVGVSGISVLVAVTSLLTTTVGPASAAGTLTSSVATLNPGVETHVGIPFSKAFPPFNETPCAIFTAYTYNVTFPTAATGTATVAGHVFDHVNATVNSSVNQWFENPDGTFTDPACENQSPGRQITGFTLALVGANLAGDTLSCVSAVNASNYYTRSNTFDVDYVFPSAPCTVNLGRPGSTSATESIHFDLTLARQSVMPVPPFDWDTLCTGPIAPAGCLSEGSVTFSP